eukprot:6214397-Pleurochrysis_carterae.AAC.4
MAMMMLRRTYISSAVLPMHAAEITLSSEQFTIVSLMFFKMNYEMLAALLATRCLFARCSILHHIRY